jgi:hypothetical protein
MNASTCSRRMLASAVGHALTREECAVIGVGQQVGRLQMQSLRRQKYDKLSYAGTGTRPSSGRGPVGVPAVCTTSARGW